MCIVKKSVRSSIKGDAMFKFNSKPAISILLLTSILVTGCMSAAQHQQSLSSTNEREMTVGVVQKEIRVGMSQADVATALGSPNMLNQPNKKQKLIINATVIVIKNITGIFSGSYFISKITQFRLLTYRLICINTQVTHKCRDL